ncbi:MAG: Rnf-Nqr domain containing protein, partial [Acutalibacteraceae bacterium]
FACERFFPDFLGTLSGYLPLLAVNAMIVFRCETCAVHQPLRVSMMDALGASLGYAIVLLLLGFVRELLGSGSILGRSFPTLPKITGLLMPFGGFLLLGFMAAAVKWIYHLRHSGEEELATPVAHVDDEDVSVIEPLARLFHRKRSAVQEESAPKSKKKPEQWPKHETDALAKKKSVPLPHEKKPKKPVKKSRPAKLEHQKPGDVPPTQEPASKHPPTKRSSSVEKALKVEKVKKEAPLSAQKRPAHKPAASDAQPDSARKPRQDEEMESFADVLAALNRRRAEQESKLRADNVQDAKEKGEQP